MSNESVFEDGIPVSEDSRVWVFATNLSKYLKGSFRVIFLPDNPVEKLTDESIGSIRLQTKDGYDFLFTISNVKHGRFKKLAQHFK